MQTSEPNQIKHWRISKHILENVNSKVRKLSGLNQWKNTFSTVEWFQNLKDKKSLHFIQFDIVDFYPSITENLLQKSLNYARNFVEISESDENIIFSCKKSILFHDGKPWEKTRNSEFDITQGSYDGAEICELVGLFLLSLLQNFKNSQNLQYSHFQFGLYRDDGLCCVRLSNRQSEQLRQQIYNIFHENDLDVKIEANKRVVDFLDVTFDLQNTTLCSYEEQPSSWNTEKHSEKCQYQVICFIQP